MKKIIRKAILLLMACGALVLPIVGLFLPWAVLDIPDFVLMGYGLTTYPMDLGIPVVLIRIFAFLSFLAMLSCVGLSILRVFGINLCRNKYVRFGIAGGTVLLSLLLLLFAVEYVKSAAHPYFFIGPGVFLFAAGGIASALILVMLPSK